MNNTNSSSESLFSPASFNEPSSLSVESENSGFFDAFKSINMTTWIIIILIVAFLGFNIFVYLAEGTNSVTSFFRPIFEKIFGATAATTGQTVSVSAEGAKKVVTGTAGATVSGLNAVQNATTPTKGADLNSVNQPHDNTKDTTLNKALNNSNQNTGDYEADFATSSIQGGGKSGWCYIGMDRGVRSCSEISSSDTCMSGDIFPSREICMNPTLRP